MRAAVLCLPLAGCATAAPPVISAAPAAQVVVRAVCPPLRSYSPAQEKALGAAVAALPADSPLVAAIADYGSLRAAVRACNTN